MAVKTLSALGILYSDRRQFYITPQVVRELWPSVTPFLTTVANWSMLSTPDPDFKMFEHRSGFVDAGFRITNASPSAWSVNGDPKGYVDSLTVDTVGGLAATPDASWKGKVVEIWSSDYATYKGVARVHASSTTVTLRAIGNPRLATNRMVALAQYDRCRVIGFAWGEGKVSPEAMSDELEVVYNSTGIFRTSVEITGTLYQAALRGYSNELARLRVEAEKQHKFERELGMLLGVRIGGTGMTDLNTGDPNSGSGDQIDSFVNHDTDDESKTVRTTMGIVPTIFRYGTADTTSDKQNIFAINPSTYNFDKFVLDSEKISQYLPSAGYLYAFAGRGIMSYFSMIGKGNSMFGNSGGQVTISPNQTDKLGFTFRELETPHVTVRLVPTPAFRGPYRNSMVIINPEDIHHVTYRPSYFKTNIKTEDDYDGQKDTFFSDEGIGTTLIEKHSYWYLTENPNTDVMV